MAFSFFLFTPLHGTLSDQIHDLDFEGKRLALDMLNIMVWLGGDNIEITGTIDTAMVNVDRCTVAQ